MSQRDPIQQVDVPDAMPRNLLNRRMDEWLARRAGAATSPIDPAAWSFIATGAGGSAKVRRSRKLFRIWSATRFWQPIAPLVGIGLAQLAKLIRQPIEEDVQFRRLGDPVVEIRKSHFPVRLFTKVGPPANQLLNPLPGTYLVLDQQRALLSTTGRPGAWDKNEGRTAGTLLLNLVESSRPMDIESLTEDAYRLTHLNWSAPDIEISVPVTIRWNDDALRASLVSQQQEEDETYDETNETKMEGANV